MPNLFQEIVDRFKTLGEVGKAKTAASKAEQQRKDVDVKLQEALKRKSAISAPAKEPQTGNLFQDVVDRFKPQSVNLNTQKEGNIFQDIVQKFKPAEVVKPTDLEAQKRKAAEDLQKRIEGAKGAGEKVRQFGKDVLRAGPRAIGSLTQEARDVIAGKSREEMKQSEFIPGTGVFPAAEKFLFGEEPIESVSTREARFPERVEKFGGALGFTPDVEGLKLAAPFAIGLSTLADIVPGFPGKGSVVKQIAKESEESVIEGILKRTFKDIADEDAAVLAKRFAPVTDEKTIQTELESFAKTKVVPKPAATKKAVSEAKPVEAEKIVGRREPFEGVPDDIKAKVANRETISIDEAKTIASRLNNEGFGAAADSRRFVDDTGRPGFVLGEDLRDAELGTPDRIIFRPSPEDPTKGTISKILKPISDEEFKITEQPFTKALTERLAEQPATQAAKQIAAPKLAVGAEKEAAERVVKEAIPKDLHPLAQEAKGLKIMPLDQAVKKFEQTGSVTVARRADGARLVVKDEGDFVRVGLGFGEGKLVPTEIKLPSKNFATKEEAFDFVRSLSKPKLTPGIPPELEPLAREARKYPDSVEFTRAILKMTPEEQIKFGLVVSREKPSDLLDKNGFKNFHDFYNQAVKGVEPPKPPIAEAVAKKPSGPEREFGVAVRESPESKPELKAELTKRDLTFERLPNKVIVEKAKERVSQDVGEAVAYITKGKGADAEQVATSVELIRHFQGEKNWEKAADVAETIAEKLTNAGQTIQAAKLYTHLAPEAILLRAQKLIQKLNSNKFRWQKDIKLGPETAEQISTLAKNMQEATDPALKVEFAEELESLLRNIPRPSFLRKVSSIQTLAQLLNPKTLIRNILGNEVFFRLERLEKYTTAPFDWARVKLFGGEREVSFVTINQGTFWRDWITGARAGWKGVTPAGLGSQFDIYAPAFKEKWNPLTYLEKTLNVELRSFDYAAYKRAFSQTLGELGYTRAVNEGLKGEALKTAAKKYAVEASDEAIKIADEYGRYVTFQDNNVLSRVLLQVKKGLNLGQEFGIGDLVLKYPRTPGALLMRALEYSPVGFLRSLYLIGKPLVKARGTFNIREIELSLSRAITGSLGLTGLGYYLADKGIITGKPSETKTVKGLQQAIGAGRYQINITALKRWALSGFTDASTKPNDTLYSYDWAQPIAVALSLGANMNQGAQTAETKAQKRGPLAGVPGTAEESISGAIETITEQPLLTGLRNLFGGESPVKSALSVVESMPSSFTPTIVNQFRQTQDPISRETWDPSLLRRAINRVKSRLPGLSDELPARSDVLGRTQKVMENPNLFNIFVNPGFLSTYKPTPSAQLVLDIYDAIGETKQLPKVAPRSLVFQGKTVQLSGEQVSQFQRAIGKATDVVLSQLATNGQFTSGDNTKKAQIINYMLGKLYAKERFDILTNEQRNTLVNSMTPEQKKAFVKDLQSAF